MDPATATGQVRVAIIGERAAADLALPTTLSIRELIPRIRATLASGRDDDELTADTLDDDGPRPYSLAPLGGTPFSLDATLETLGVDDGEQLMLCKLPPGPAAPPVVEDIADASAIHSASQFKPFEHTMLAGAAQVVVLSLAALVCGLGVYGWQRGYGVWAAAAFGVLAVVFVTATVVLHRRGLRGAAGRMGVATIVPLALALAAALPGDGAAPRVFLAAAFLVAWSLLLLAVTTSWVATHSAILAVAATVAAAAAARTLAHLPYLALGCGVLAVSLLLAINAPTVSAMWARFPLPNVPAPGEPTPAPSSLAEIEDLPRKTAICNSYQSGLIAASVILSVIGSVLVVWLPARPSLLAWWLVVAATIVTVLRMRIWDSAIPALWFLATPFLTAAALSVSFTATGHLVAGLYAAAAVAGLTLVLLVAAALKPRELSIPQRRWLDLFENTLLVTIPPAMLWLTGLISLIRNRGAL
ncbi:type VII secretion integral membrane protein EccD [Mycobacterium xenopi]|uniref:type VII secretion integral membrane protein EccD n=1 Tax=Mycobacterium xenopi TaxID=1789 RepID=UPI000A154E94|nr:type VII secretion integral membrane protein EccD [Mycobacterium xenopi]ORX21130.1 type VII secretion integral membrane protein EccD [Mycobacterium xenopi]SPX94838.1 type VII secretion integral membrane protein EccD [Mycobacterium xenopi]